MHRHRRHTKRTKRTWFHNKIDRMYWKKEKEAREYSPTLHYRKYKDTYSTNIMEDLLVRIEPKRTHATVQQFHQCQRFGRNQHGRKMAPRCHRCSEDHYFTECKKPRTTHAASDKALIPSITGATQRSLPANNHNIQLTKPTQETAIRTMPKQAPPKTSPSSYSQAVKSTLYHDTLLLAIQQIHQVTTAPIGILAAANPNCNCLTQNS